jgi:hypothetical protein
LPASGKKYPTIVILIAMISATNFEFFTSYDKAHVLHIPSLMQSVHKLKRSMSSVTAQHSRNQFGGNAEYPQVCKPRLQHSQQTHHQS